MRERLLVMADSWEELDEFNRSTLTELADKASEVAESLVDEEGLGARDDR